MLDNKYLIVNIYNNRYIIIFILITLIILNIYDERFTTFRKVIITLAYVSFIIIVGLFMGKEIPLFLKDLFWYSVLLNVSFLWHVLWLNWLFHLCWIYRWEKLCFIFSRLSWITSLCGIKVFLNILRYKTYYYIFSDKWCNFYDSIFLVVDYLLNFYIIIFHRYITFLMGNVNKLSLYSLVQIFSFFFLTLFLSIYVLGISRIYIVWIYIIFIELIRGFINYAHHLWDKKVYLKPNYSLLEPYSKKKDIKSSIMYYLICFYFIITFDFKVFLNSYLVYVQELFILENINNSYTINFNYIWFDYLIWLRFKGPFIGVDNFCIIMKNKELFPLCKFISWFNVVKNYIICLSGPKTAKLKELKKCSLNFRLNDLEYQKLSLIILNNDNT